MPKRKWQAFVLSILVSVPAVQSQTSPPAHSEKPPGPVVMIECEGTAGCATWKFFGKRDNYLQGIGTGPSGEAASLLLKVVDHDTVIIERTDPNSGYTAEYIGKQDRDGLAGKFTATSPVAKTGNWYATLAATLPLPAKMKFCGPYACHDLVLRNGNYESVDANGNPSGTKWTVEQFTAEGVRIKRADPDGYAATLTGKISPGENKITGQQAGNRNGTVAFVMTWGSAYGDAQQTPQPPGSGARVGVTPGEAVAGMNLLTAILNAWTFGDYW